MQISLGSRGGKRRQVSAGFWGGSERGSLSVAESLL